MGATRGTAFQLLEDFVRSCFFIHDDTLNELVTDTGLLNWDQFGTNPFFLGAQVCVVDTLDGFGQEYLSYLHGLKCLPEMMIIPNHQKPSLLENLLMDEGALQQLRMLSQERRLHISSFYSDEEKNFELLITHLSKDDYIPRLYPAQDIFQQTNDKLFMRSLMLKAGVPVPEGEVCNSIEELLHICRYNREHGSITLLKKLHWQTQAISHESDLSAEVDTLKFPVIAEKAYELSFSPVSHYIAFKNRVGHLFSVNQIVEHWRHYGNVLPHGLSNKVQSQMQSYSSAILQQLPSYEGVCGVDYIVTRQNGVFAVDFNPRFNSSTYPFFCLQRLGVHLESIYAHYRFARIPIKNLSDIFTDKQFKPFNLKQLEGILMMSPVFDFARGIVIRFLYLNIARNPSDLRRQEETLQHILEKHRVASS